MLFALSGVKSSSIIIMEVEHERFVFNEAW